MKEREKPVDISAINVGEIESWIHGNTDRQNAVKCKALIALTKNVGDCQHCKV